MTSNISSTVFLSCEASSTSGSTAEILQCISDRFEDDSSAKARDLNDFLLVIAGAMIFFMQSGFAMLCAGSVRLKNVQNTMLKNLLDACGAALAFYLVGYAFAFGGQDDTANTTFIGYRGFASTGLSASFWFFEYTFSATSVTIVAGTLAERCQMVAYLCYSVALAGFVYPVVAHSVWSNNGFLSISNSGNPLLNVGSIDFAGSGVVHVTGGTTALLATLILGPRRGRFFDAQGEPLEKPKPFPGHSVALQLLGTMVLWFGWFGFNPGSALVLDIDNPGQVAAVAAASTALSGAAGGITALFTNLYIVERLTGEPYFSITHAMNGSLSGLVAITSGCGVVDPWAAIVIGMISGWIYIGASELLVRLRIDDAVDAIPVHMFNGIWGVLATGLFASPRLMDMAYPGRSEYPGLFFTLGKGKSFRGNLLLCQITLIVFIIAWVFVTMMPFFIWLNYKGWLRADSLEELVGLDVSYHGRSIDETDGDVKVEYIEAFKKHRGALRTRRVSRSRQVNSSYGDPESCQEAAAQEAFDASQ
mmetsp:Transcript_15514/g.35765  ORF Transcript_15514/g.35765 Transcript_15514/m.35765 type:complete len:533 (-) Transcript_15514:373-1971(-)